MSTEMGPKTGGIVVDGYVEEAKNR